MRRCVVLGHGEISDYDWHAACLREDDIIICADGGTEHAARLGVVPRGIAGDLDSVSPEVLAKLRALGVEVRQYPSAKDYIDSHLALAWALEFEPDEVLLLGCAGSRLDHTVCNLHLLLFGAERGIRVKLTDERQEVLLVTPELPAEIIAEAGALVSLLPLGERVSGIETENLAYKMPEGALQAGRSIGISNVATGGPVRVRIGAGNLLVFVNRR